MAEDIPGTKIAAELNDETKKKIEEIRKQHQDFKPTVAFLQVGDREDAQVYVDRTTEAANKVGIAVQHKKLGRSATQDEVIGKINELNADSKVHGILLLLPMDSEHKINTETVINSIDKKKDVEGLRWENVGEIAYEPATDEIIPCAAAAYMKLIKYTKVAVAEKLAVIVGTSRTAGLQIQLLLLREKCNTIICLPETPDAAQLTKQADIVVATGGGSNKIGENWIKPGAVVIDGGFYIDESGKRSGNVDYEVVKKVAAWISPVPGGTGPVTVAKLLHNTVLLAQPR